MSFGRLSPHCACALLARVRWAGIPFSGETRQSDERRSERNAAKVVPIPSRRIAPEARARRSRGR